MLFLCTYNVICETLDHAHCQFIQETHTHTHVTHTMLLYFAILEPFRHTYVFGTCSLDSEVGIIRFASIIANISDNKVVVVMQPT